MHRPASKDCSGISDDVDQLDSRFKQSEHSLRPLDQPLQTEQFDNSVAARLTLTADDIGWERATVALSEEVRIITNPRHICTCKTPVHRLKDELKASIVLSDLGEPLKLGERAVEEGRRHGDRKLAILAIRNTDRHPQTS